MAAPKPRNPDGILFRITRMAAAAAAILLVAYLTGVFSTNDNADRLTNTGPHHVRPALTGDVNADGIINIVDAYLLQRRIEQHATLASHWDLSGDGQVNAQDVQAIAAAAVRIQRVAMNDRGSRIADRGLLMPADGTMFVRADAVRFTTFDIIIDTADAPLAVYQVDISATQGEVQITGIEGGEHEAFKQPPYYDPQAMQQSRVILAAFNTADGDKLPRGKVRVATLHVQITGAPGDAEPKFEVKLEAATVEGKAINATATLQPRRTQL